MKTAQNIIFLLLSVTFLFIIGKGLTKKVKYDIGDCLHGNAYYYQVVDKSRFFYDLKMINHNMYLMYKVQVVHKAFTKVNCDEIPTNANLPTK